MDDQKKFEYALGVFIVRALIGLAVGLGIALLLFLLGTAAVTSGTGLTVVMGIVMVLGAIMIVMNR